MTNTYLNNDDYLVTKIIIVIIINISIKIEFWLYYIYV